MHIYIYIYIYIIYKQECCSQHFLIKADTIITLFTHDKLTVSSHVDHTFVTHLSLCYFMYITRLSQNYHTNIPRYNTILSHDYHTITTYTSHACHMYITQLAHDYHTIITRFITCISHIYHIIITRLSPIAHTFTTCISRIDVCFSSTD